MHLRRVEAFCLTGLPPSCANRNNRKPWDILCQVRARILEFVWGQHVSNGLRLAAIKFMQRVVLVQTRGVNDPRVRTCSMTCDLYRGSFCG